MTRKLFVKTIIVKSEKELQDKLRTFNTGSSQLVQYICKEGDAREGRRYQITYTDTE